MQRHPIEPCAQEAQARIVELEAAAAQLEQALAAANDEVSAEAKRHRKLKKENQAQQDALAELTQLYSSEATERAEALRERDAVADQCTRQPTPTHVHAWI